MSNPIPNLVSVERIVGTNLLIRGEKVILDSDWRCCMRSKTKQLVRR
jgi:hypothetical protein